MATDTIAYVWLIERGQPEGSPRTKWWGVTDPRSEGHGWVDSAWDADRFATREEADAIIARFDRVGHPFPARAVEHGFSPGRGGDEGLDAERLAQAYHKSICPRSAVAYHSCSHRDAHRKSMGYVARAYAALAKTAGPRDEGLLERIEALPTREANGIWFGGYGGGEPFPGRNRDEWVEVVEKAAVRAALAKADADR